MLGIYIQRTNAGLTVAGEKRDGCALSGSG
jgi:hypothetical protein